MKSFMLILLGTLSTVPLAMADTVFLLQSSATNCLGNINCNLGNATQVVQNGTASVSGTYGSAADQAQMTATASAISTYGALGAGASIEYNISSTPTRAESDSNAVVEDVITVNFAPFTGSEGFMNVGYTLDGTISETGTAGAFSNVSIMSTQLNGTQLPGDLTYEATYTDSTSGSFLTPGFTFVYGRPFELSLDLDAVTGTVSPNEIFRGLGTGTASADFFNTLVLSGLIVTDSNGNPVEGVTFSSASGTQYTVDGVAPVPEPSSIALLLVGLTTGVVRRIAWSRN
jgi:hypothetical protein